jgi:cell wall-associated NlpC family hydrolase
VWQSLDVPALGVPDASHAASKVEAAGHLQYHYSGDGPPRGSIVYWKGGSHGYGHMALSLGGGRILTTDPPGHSGGVGETSVTMPRERWGLRYVGWSTWYGVELPK